MRTAASERSVAPVSSRKRPDTNKWIAPSAWFVVVLAVAALALFAFLLHRGDPEGAARTSNSEIDASLEGGEVVLERVAVRQRYWWDYFRQTHGVIAATDRRLIYTGVLPEPLLRGEDGPPELMQSSFPYTRPLRIVPGRVFLGTSRGVTIEGPGTSETFAVGESELPRLEALIGIVGAKLDSLAQLAEAERRAADAAAAAARRPIYHLVQAGEALEVIARRYGVSMDSLRVWNNRSDSRIRVGERLLVRPGR